MTPRLPWRSLTIAFAIALSTAVAQAQPPRPMPPGAGDAAQELTRGPIHEAFGQPTVFDPQPGPVAPKAPPEAIEEVPPDQKPEGDNVTWIPGYWAWDDEGKEFIWVSGFWRAIPPDQTWVPGYWNKTDEGYQWVSGYWTSTKVTEVEYLPPPPETLESGPSTEATAENQIWIPGCWIWREVRYVWRPGFWATANPDWVWVPAHYEWAPAGYVFVDGYWDYPLDRRGLLFSPVVFTAVRPGFVYQPTVVIDVRILIVSLFVRPTYNHYLFGDYYDPNYVRGGIYPWFAFHNSRHGYDPLFAQMSIVQARRDPQWVTQLREAYWQRRENEAARPPHTFRQYQEWLRKAGERDRAALAIARPLSEIPTVRDFPVRLERADERRLETVKQQAKQIRDFQQQRVQLEQKVAKEATRTTDPKTGRPAALTAPVKVKVPEPPKLAPSKAAAAVRPPEPPRITETTAPATPPAKTRPRLPDPEENLRPGKAPKVGGKTPGKTEPPERKEPVPPVKTEPPEKKERPKVVFPPPGKEPPEKVEPPKKEPPPKVEPPKKEPPKKEPPKKEKDKEKDKDKDKD